MLDNKVKESITQWIVKYPQENKRSAIMETLRLTQVANNNTLTTELIKEVAEFLDIAPISAMEVATFYENYNVDAAEYQHQIRICHNISCQLNGADELIKQLEEKLNIKAGQVTADGKFHLKKVECLGACVGAPVMQIGDNYYENLTLDKISEILERL